MFFNVINSLRIGFIVLLKPFPEPFSVYNVTVNAITKGGNGPAVFMLNRTNHSSKYILTNFSYYYLIIRSIYTMSGHVVYNMDANHSG